MFFTRKKKQQAAVQPGSKAGSAEPSFLGRNCTIEGHVICDGELHIDGTVRGTVQAGMCVVDQAGIVHGSVTGDVLHVRGRVLGPSQGSNVYIHAGAHVEGDVFNDTISIENGAYVYGSIRHNTAPSANGPSLKAGGLLNGYSNGAPPPVGLPPPTETKSVARKKTEF
jgi:cytoskeletal protein CcmA (bactofilin family)